MDNQPAAGSKVLALPTAKPAHFTNNFIHQAVCELRFPTLYDLEGPRPPIPFAHAIRKEYPTTGVLRDVNVNGPQIAQSTAHSFRSKNGKWVVTLRASSLTLETSNYDSFGDFEERLGIVFAAAVKVIDTDFLTRIGLRYVNSVPLPVGVDIAQWVNSNLVGTLASGLYGDVHEHSQRVAGPTHCGGYLFQHGLGEDSRTNARAYGLDFDFFKEDVATGDALKVVRELHDLEFSMFQWSLGPAAKAYLGPSTLKA